MNDSIWGKLLLALSPPLLAVFIGTIKSIINNVPSPTRRKYWAGELPRRIELANSRDLTPQLRDKLSSRAEMALEYLDADEAIRRARVTGSAPVWLLAVSSYMLGIGIGLQISLGAFHPVLIVVALSFVAVGVWAQLVATQMPGRRQELIRVLVEVQGADGGYAVLLRSPEEIVSLWVRYRARLRRHASKRCRRQSKIVTYEKYAEELLKLNAIYGRFFQMKNRNRRKP